MRDFVTTYIELIQTNYDMVGQVHQDFKRQFLDMTVDKLLEQFVLNKYTGLEKPGTAFKHNVSRCVEQFDNPSSFACKIFDCANRMRDKLLVPSFDKPATFNS